MEQPLNPEKVQVRILLASPSIQINKYMEKAKINKSIGGHICTLVCMNIFIVFLILKLAEIGSVATWSWWWVTSPLWLPLVAIIGFYFVLAVIMFLTFVISLVFTSKTKKNDNSNQI